MTEDVVQISKDTHCSQCEYVVIAKSIMHVIDLKYYCALCADGMRRKGVRNDS